MARIAYFGAADGLLKSLQTAASRAGFKGQFQPTTNVEEFASLSKETKKSLGGPTLARNVDVCEALGLHTRVLRSFGPANIPKPRDLYSGISYTVATPVSAATLSRGPDDVTAVDSYNLHTAKITRDALSQALEPSVDAVAQLAEKAASITFASMAADDSAAQKLYLSAVRAKLGKGKSVEQISFPNAFNNLLVAPEHVGLMVVAPSFRANTFMQATANALGGDGMVAYSWMGRDATVHHVGEHVKDDANANFYGLAIALCELLAESDRDTANRLYAALRKAAHGADTYSAGGQLASKVAAAV